jgi:hypothetical protein
MSKAQKLLEKWRRSLSTKSIAFPNLGIVTRTPLDKTPITGPPRLPTELLIVILDFVYGRIELSRLCRTCHLFRTIAEPRLYYMYLSHSKWFRNTEIRQVIRHTRLELVLSAVSLHLYSWKECNGKTKQWQPSFLRNSKGHEATCACDKLDESLGQALRHLTNLRVLRLVCYLHIVQSCQRHGWISALETRSLQEIDLSCHCSKIHEEATINIFSAPPMNSVTMLGWHVHRSMSESVPSLETHLVTEPILPKLRYLDHQGSVVETVLLRHRPITRLSCTLGLLGTLNCEDMREKQGITHLNIRLNKWRTRVSETFSLNYVAENLSAFQNLQHIGPFLLSSLSPMVIHDTTYSDNHLSDCSVGFL